MTIDKTYDPQGIETRWYQTWEQRGDFAPRGGEAPPYCIMIPPPNVTGSLHMGHAFQDTLMDVLVRYHRMRGDNTLWQVGADHAGIATQMVVERRLAAEGQTRHDLGRETFVERVWEWKAESGGHITRQLRRLGASVDWSRERFTMDAQLSRAVVEVFVGLFEKGLIYRGKRLVNWDPVLHTAVSDLEVISEEEQGQLWHLRYPLTDSDEHVVVATTRPETMLGDTAVAVNPADERYRHLVGRRIRLPLAEREIPIIADDYVDMEFGTGCLKITPAHDFNDYAMGVRHGLAQINVLTEDARLNDNAPRAYRGLDRFEARKRIVADLKAAGLLERTEAHTLMVPRGDRTGAVIEPYLTDQWFVRAEPLARPAIQAVEDGRIRFVPDNWRKTYFEWMRNIQDWCISRQIWWGHRVPAWYCTDCDAEHIRYTGDGLPKADPEQPVGGGTLAWLHAQGLSTVQARDLATSVHVGDGATPIVSRHATEACPRCGGTAFQQDADVLDTWFSSALWPFSTLGWPEDTADFRTFYPTSVLVTGFDIIFFWVARMIMMGLEFTGDVPFRDVYIHGLVRDSEGQKMSKSKGNVLDPIDLIDGIDLDSLVTKRTQGLMQPQMAERIAQDTRKHFPDGIPAFGTDALRFTFAALASQGRDIRFDLARVAGYRNFCNKLWNAARFVLLNTEGEDTGLDPNAAAALSTADRWIVSRLQETEAMVTSHIEAYRFDLAARALYDFVWHEYCDWYLELAKPVLQGEAATAAQRRGTRRTLVRVLETLLRMAHPFMPFITEEIWQRVAPLAGCRDASIMHQPYPVADTARRDPEAEAEIAWVQTFILGVRRIRGEMDITPGKALPVLLHNAGARDRQRLEAHRMLLDVLGRIDSVRVLDDHEAPPEAATALLGEMKILVPMAGLIDKAAELGRLDKELQRLTKDMERAKAKLANPKFTERAPADVVQKERTRAEEAGRAIEELRRQQARIRAL